jgi:hypothetical protein
MKCSCGGKIEKINRKKMRCIRCGAEFSVVPADSEGKGFTHPKKPLSGIQSRINVN